MRGLNPTQAIVFNRTLGRENADGVEEMARLVRDLKVRLYVAPMRKGAGADADADDNVDRVLPWEEQRPIWARLVALRDQGYPIQNSYHYMRHLAKQAKPPPYRCHWPKIAIGIDANGDIVDCMDWANPITNVRDGLLRDLVQHPRMIALRSPTGGACNACSVPGRVEPSRFWSMSPAMVGGAIQSLVLRR